MVLEMTYPQLERAVNPTHDIKLFAGRSNPKLAQEIADYLSKLPQGDTNAVLAQEFISTAKGKDIRVVVADYKVVRVIQRVAGNPDEFRSNVHLGGYVKPYTLDEDAVKMCEKVAKVCGLRLCGIDLLEAEKRWICGVLHNVRTLVLLV